VVWCWREVARCKASGKTEERRKGKVADEKVRIGRKEDGVMAKVRDRSKRGKDGDKENGH
jgi:hypothetical protein